MHSKLLQSVIERHAFTVVGEADWPAFAEQHEHVMLLISGDAVRLPECDDLAIVFPELAKVFGHVVKPAVAAKDAERGFQRRFRFAAVPALVLVRHGAYLGAISRIRDWSDYLSEIPEILARQPSEPPPFKFLDRPEPASRENPAPLPLHH